MEWNSGYPESDEWLSLNTSNSVMHVPLPMTATQFTPILFLHSDRHKTLVSLLTEESLWTSCCYSSFISFLNNGVYLNVYICPYGQLTLQHENVWGSEDVLVPGSG